MKEFLAVRGIAFESINVLEDDGGMDKLRALGARSVPILTAGCSGRLFPSRWRWCTWSWSPTPATAVCIQLPQTTSQVDDRLVEAFMNRELANGRTRFETVRGISTVLCAY